MTLGNQVCLLISWHEYAYVMKLVMTCIGHRLGDCIIQKKLRLMNTVDFFIFQL